MTRIALHINDSKQYDAASAVCDSFACQNQYYIFPKESVADTLSRLNNAYSPNIIICDAFNFNRLAHFATETNKDLEEIRIILFESVENLHKISYRGTDIQLRADTPQDLMTCLKYTVKNNKIRLKRDSYSKKSIRTVKSEAGIIGNDDKLMQVIRMAYNYAQKDRHILITGEPGTGKELFANFIYLAGSCSKDRFIPVHMGAIPETLYESVLFGHEKGAFTDAKKNNPGRFKEAGKGMLFLDEIGTIPLTVQAKLLRVLENRDYFSVGSNNVQTLQARVVCATNTDLVQEIYDKRFRQDLYDRISRLQIDIPPLRDRKEDIPALCRHLLDNLGHRDKNLSKPLMDFLVSYDFPGNVRELESILDRMALNSQTDLLVISDAKYAGKRIETILTGKKLWASSGDCKKVLGFPPTGQHLESQHQKISGSTSPLKDKILNPVISALKSQDGTRDDIISGPKRLDEEKLKSPSTTDTLLERTQNSFSCAEEPSYHPSSEKKEVIVGLLEKHNGLLPCVARDLGLHLTRLTNNLRDMGLMDGAFGKKLEERATNHLLNILDRNNNEISLAAKELKLSYQTLYNELKKRKIKITQKNMTFLNVEDAETEQ